ncbi:MAG: DUF4065 domain-containing protein [Chloroherpetonaceae bacterium]|nr:DUF4065 domain-containing protein [Chloroherpetonaceae bacterium]
MNRLNRLTVSIVETLGKVGVFHYNKLAYLFEYIYIKNFGVRYTNERFIKLPNGPVINNYKKQIELLFEENLLKVDVTQLNQKRSVDDNSLKPIWIEPTSDSKNFLVEDEDAVKLLSQMLNRYAKLSASQLENVVYQTEPMLRITQNEGTKEKKSIGVEVLDTTTVKNALKNDRIQGKKLALEHLKKYPFPNNELQDFYAQELAPLALLRPKYESES